MAASKRVGTEKGRSTSESTESIRRRLNAVTDPNTSASSSRIQSALDDYEKRRRELKDVNSHKWKGSIGG